MDQMKRRLRAAAISFFIPGGGQIYRKRFLSGIFFLVFFVSLVLFHRIVWIGFHPFSYFVLFSYLVLWIGNIIDAYKGPYYFPAPCDIYCPAGIRPSLYILYLSEDRGREALKGILDTVPFPGTLGRICFAPCEYPCSRSGTDESIRIRYLKRFIFDNEFKDDFKVPKIRNNGKKVAIIGGGVAGITAGYNLRIKGYQVVIFEREEVAGGMLTMGVPDYRLPKWVVEEEISYVKKFGVEIKTGIEIGKDRSFKGLMDEFDAIFIATGSHLNNELNVGEKELKGIYYGLNFLKALKRGSPPSVGEKTVVIGGGDVGVDAARSALRLGSRVALIPLESREEMPAFEKNVKRAMEEGVEIINSWGIDEILGERKVRAVKLKRCCSVYDEVGEFKPSFDESFIKVEECETLILSIGQRPDLSFLPGGIIVENGRIIVDNALRTSVPGVFAGGDLLGPSTAVEAVADGKKAARSIDLYLRGIHARIDNLLSFVEYPVSRCPLESNAPKGEPLKIPAKEKNHNFDEIEGSCSYSEGVLEAKRCLKCPLRFGSF